MKERSCPNHPPLVEERQFELLDLLEVVRIAGELWKRVLYANALHLLGEQVGFVEEEYDGDFDERLIVDDCVEDVARLDEAVRLAILVDHLIELARRHEEEDRLDAVEALVPLLALRPLSADVDEEEWFVLDDELVFGDALGCLASVENVRVDRKVIL